MTDRERQFELLKQAERHIAEGERHIADQERRIIELGRSGLNATKARTLLELFRETQAKHIDHRDMLLRELKL